MCCCCRSCGSYCDGDGDACSVGYGSVTDWSPPPRRRMCSDGDGLYGGSHCAARNPSQRNALSAGARCCCSRCSCQYSCSYGGCSGCYPPWSAPSCWSRTGCARRGPALGGERNGYGNAPNPPHCSACAAAWVWSFGESDGRIHRPRSRCWPACWPDRSHCLSVFGRRWSRWMLWFRGQACVAWHCSVLLLGQISGGLSLLPSPQTLAFVGHPSAVSSSPKQTLPQLLKLQHQLLHHHHPPLLPCPLVLGSYFSFACAFSFSLPFLLGPRCLPLPQLPLSPSSSNAYRPSYASFSSSFSSSCCFFSFSF